MDTNFMRTGEIFDSFWIGGYECSDKLNAFGERVDLLKETAHIQLLREDYARLLPFNIRTVREGIRWSQVERTPYEYDWTTVGHMLDVGKEFGIQQVWDLCHFGFPDDLTPLHPMFARRFAAMCRSFVTFYRSHSHSRLVVTPINEVSFLAWLGGEVRGTSPYCLNMGWEVKYALMRAYIEGVREMKKIDPSVLILSTEPLVQIVPAFDASEAEIIAAEQANNDQFQTIEMLTGIICPELGGAPELLDVIGLNFYFNNRWEHSTDDRLPWVNDEQDDRWRSMAQLMAGVYHRYERPLLLAETSHPGEHRPNWIAHIAEECASLLQNDIPLLGVCLYPVIDRPDWDHLHIWHRSGLWDHEMVEGTTHTRILNEEYANALYYAQALVEDAKMVATLV